jgi:hypothetical protein
MKLLFINKKDVGISLIELLIVITLLSLIVEGLFSVYLHTKEHHKHNNALQEMTEETRFVNQLLNRAIQGAGYLGIVGWEKIPVYDAIHQVFLPNAMLILNENDEQLAENVKKKIKPGTQALELRQMDFNVTSLSEPVSMDVSDIKVEENVSLKWKNQDYVLIADYEHAEINCINSIQKLSDNKRLMQLSVPLHYRYEKGAYVGHYLDKIYFVGDTGEKFPDKQTVYGLYMYSENGMTEEVTEFVADIHFQWLKEKTMQIMITLRFPYWVNGKFFERHEEFIVANRE